MFRDAVPNFHSAWAAPGNEGERSAWAEEGMIDRVAEVEESLEESTQFLFENPFLEIGSVNSKNGGFTKRFDEGNRDKEACVFLGAEDELEDLLRCEIGPING